MQLLKTAVLILTAVTAEFAPHTTKVGNSVKNIFQRNPLSKLIKSVETAGRRLQGPMSPECYAACDGAEDAMKDIIANGEAISKGDWSSMCGKLDVLACMEKATECKDPNAEEAGDGEDEGLSSLACGCACPDMAKMETMSEEDYCKAGNPLECLSTKSECSGMFDDHILKGGSRADHDKGMEIHCKSIELKCGEKGEKVPTCGGTELQTWESSGCDDAAKAGTLSDKADTCFAAGSKIVECYTIECIKLSMEGEMLKAKDASAEEKAEVEKEMQKNFEIGKACPASGMPQSEADVTSSGSSGDSTDGASWASVSHATAFVAMIGGLLV